MTPNEKEEREIQETIFKHVDNFTSFRFNAGAGAGKTFALIETLKHVVVNQIAAKRHSHQAMCITYTNVAVNEIKSRLGTSEIVLVSTIHERMWQLIKRYQRELLECHKARIKQVLKQERHELYHSGKDDYHLFVELSEAQRGAFIDFVLNTKDLFYNSTKLKATEFEAAYLKNSELQAPEFLPQCLTRKTGKFKKTVKQIYRIADLETCLLKIEVGDAKRVEYDSRVNTDKLHKMKFSHDTLLEYGLQLVEKYPPLCRIIVDSYPYVFIDEYQDTHENVVKFLEIVHQYAKDHDKKWMVGYFGDTAQCIYEDGIGEAIVDVHSELEQVNKIFNRRSHQQIIDVANTIRADEIQQQSICEDRTQGTVKFYHSNLADKKAVADDFLAAFQAELHNQAGHNIVNSDSFDNEQNRINCLLLTNAMVAEYNEFGDTFEAFCKSRIFFNERKNQILSHQLEKLHSSIFIIYQLVKLYLDVKEGVVSYRSVFGSSSSNMTFGRASMVIRELDTSTIASFKDWITLIVTTLDNEHLSEALGKALINRINLDNKQVTGGKEFEDAILDSINTLMNDDAEDVIKAAEKVNKVLTLPIESLVNWIQFIDNTKFADINFHTYHGTKGEEYQNVAIVLEHSFGKDDNKFKDYFAHLQKPKHKIENVQKDDSNKHSNDEEKQKLLNTRNLLYVACTRAIKNLWILYLDDISEIKKGIESIFQQVTPWQVNQPD